MLRELGGRDSTDPAVLDLLARIHAQRGELFDADECWALALRQDADFAPARAGRQRVAALVLSRQRPRTGRVVVTVAVVAIALAGATAAGGWLLSDRGADPAVLDLLDAVRESQRAQADRLEDIDKRLAESESPLPDVSAALAGDPSLLVRADADQVVVTFPVGVFRSLARLSDDGTAVLADLG